MKLVLAVAPYINVAYHDETFIEELDRLLEQDPKAVVWYSKKYLRRMTRFDYEDQLKKLLKKLADSGRREDVLRYLNRIRKLPGAELLYKQLTQ